MIFTILSNIFICFNDFGFFYYFILFIVRFGDNFLLLLLLWRNGDLRWIRFTQKIKYWRCPFCCDCSCACWRCCCFWRCFCCNWKRFSFDWCLCRRLYLLLLLLFTSSSIINWSFFFISICIFYINLYFINEHKIKLEWFLFSVSLIFRKFGRKNMNSTESPCFCFFSYFRLNWSFKIFFQKFPRKILILLFWWI